MVVPVTSLYQWEQEIQRFVNPGSLQLFTFYGAGKALPDDVGTGRRTAKVLVLTTFSKLEREHRDLSVPEGQALPTKRKSFACEAVAEPPLFQIPWQRVVLDEAHRVRNLASLTSQAAMRLKASGLLLVKAVPVIGITNQVSDSGFRLPEYLFLRTCGACYIGVRLLGKNLGFPEMVCIWNSAAEPDRRAGMGANLFGV